MYSIDMQYFTRHEVIAKVAAGESLEKANLRGLNLRGAGLRGANLGKACLCDAHLSGAQYRAPPRHGGLMASVQKRRGRC